MYFDHVALLVRSIEETSKKIASFRAILGMIEIQERTPKTGAPFITAIELPTGGRSTIVGSLRPSGEQVSNFKESPDNNVWITFNGQRMSITSLA